MLKMTRSSNFTGDGRLCSIPPSPRPSPFRHAARNRTRSAPASLPPPPLHRCTYPPLYLDSTTLLTPPALQDPGKVVVVDISSIGVPLAGLVAAVRGAAAAAAAAAARLDTAERSDSRGGAAAEASLQPSRSTSGRTGWTSSSSCPPSSSSQRRAPPLRAPRALPLSHSVAGSLAARGGGRGRSSSRVVARRAFDARWLSWRRRRAAPEAPR